VNLEGGSRKGKTDKKRRHFVCHGVPEGYEFGGKNVEQQGLPGLERMKRLGHGNRALGNW